MQYAGGHDEEKPDVGFLLACSSLLFAPTCHSLVFFTIGHHGRTGLGLGLLFLDTCGRLGEGNFRVL